MTIHDAKPCRPRVLLWGNTEHRDFADSLACLRTTTSADLEPGTPPELIVVAQARPGEISHPEIESLRQRYPLAGVVSLLGSWCEGETRTGRPWPGVMRLYWYEFHSWWKRQLELHRAGRCPDWARPDAARLDILNPKGYPTRRKIRNPHRGLVVLSTEYSETADALGDLSHRGGYSTVWERPGGSTPIVRGVTAGIWDGGQLNDTEAADLMEFCRRMARDAASVIALLDFPRKDRVERARAAGAAAVLGKPWLNGDLLASLETAATERRRARAA